MSLSIGANLITGIMMGFEYAYVEEVHYVVIDILFLRLVIEVE